MTSSIGPGDALTFNVRNVRQEAGNAVAYGMTWDDALRAITLTPSEALGVADRLGSIAVGRVANLVVWDGDPFEFTKRATHLYIRGALQTGVSRQERTDGAMPSVAAARLRRVEDGVERHSRVAGRRNRSRWEDRG